jgi:hypothetical protein
MKISALLIILGICLFGCLSAEIINVPDEYPTIQEGIDGAVDGDTVLVDQGIYLENVNFRGKGILLTSNYIFTKDSLDIYNTIIEGGSHAHPDTGSCVLFTSGENYDSRLYGLTIQFGTFTRSSNSTMGGGIFIHGSNPVIESNIINDNGVGWGVPSKGGGIAILDNSEPYILSNIIINNYAGAGGGIHSRESEGVIRGNIIESNDSYNDGGGITMWWSNHIIEQNLFIRNSTGVVDRGWGGGIFVIPGDIGSVIRNNTFYDNWANVGGGGIYVEVGFHIVITNNIFMLNEPRGIGVHYWDSVILLYNDLWSNIPDDYSPGEFDISEDPLFVDAENDDFHLLPDSPCIDAGNPATPNIPWGGFRSDMGAFEFDQGFYFNFQNLIRKPVPIEFPIRR